jgi:hypothetical protein
MILDFIRNKIVEVEPLPDGSLTVSWNLKDSLLEAEVKLGVRLPDLEITEAFARLRRFPHQKCLPATEREFESDPDFAKSCRDCWVGPKDAASCPTPFWRPVTPQFCISPGTPSNRGKTWTMIRK